MRSALALTVRVCPGESFQSWVERLTHRLGLNLAEALHLLGIAEEPQSRAIPNGCFLDVEPSVLNEVARLTHHTTEQLAATLVSSYRGTVLPTGWRPGTGWVEWVHQAGSLLCPDCIADRSWRLAWKLPWSFACIDHGRLLVGTCPSCERPLGGHRSDRSCLPAFSGSRPLPGRCLNAKSNGDGSRYKNRCGYDLAVIPALTADNVLAEAQRTINGVLDTGRGVLFGESVASLEWFEALRSSFALWSYAGQSEDLHLRHPELTRVIRDHVDRRAETEDARRQLRERGAGWWAGPAVRHWGVVPREPLFVAALMPRAIETVTGPLGADRPDLDLLAERVKARRPKQTEAGYRQFHTPEQLAKDLIRRSTRLVRFAIRNDECGDVAGLEARHIPTLFWSNAYHRHLRTLFPSNLRDHIGRRFCSMAFHRLLFGGTWSHAAEATVRPARGLSVSHSRYTKLLRDQGTEDRFKYELSELAARMAAQPAELIDYHARRERFAGWDIPEADWKLLAGMAGRSPGYGVRRINASAWCWAELTGGHWADAPIWDEDRPTPNQREVYYRFDADELRSLRPALETYLSVMLTGDRSPLDGARPVLFPKPKESLAEVRPDLADHWHATRNGHVTADQVAPQSNRKVWWQCPETGREWEAIVQSVGRYGLGCRYCRPRAQREKTCLADEYPGLVAEWHPTRNAELTPAHVGPMSNRRVWWLCACGSEWETRIADRTLRGQPGCASCRRGNPGPRPKRVAPHARVGAVIAADRDASDMKPLTHEHGDGILGSLL